MPGLLKVPSLPRGRVRRPEGLPAERPQRSDVPLQRLAGSLPRFVGRLRHPRDHFDKLPKGPSVPRVVSENASGLKDVLVPMRVPMRVLETASTAEVAPDIPGSTFRVSGIARGVREGVPRVTPKVASLPRVAPRVARVSEAVIPPGFTTVSKTVGARAGPSSGLLLVTTCS